jgi:hypothetical protein
MNRGGTKGFSDHLGPLERYLRSQVGRPWNKVYSEIAAHIRPSNALQQHILSHLFGYVELHAVSSPRNLTPSSHQI